MKKNTLTLFLLVFVSVILVSCGSQNNNTGKASDSNGTSTDSNAKPVLSFEKDYHDFIGLLEHHNLLESHEEKKA